MCITIITITVMSRRAFARMRRRSASETKAFVDEGMKHTMQMIDDDEHDDATGIATHVGIAIYIDLRSICTMLCIEHPPSIHANK